MTGFLRRLLLSIGGVGLLMSLVIGARADSISFTDTWKDSAQTAGGVTTISSVDNGTFNISLTIPGLGNLTTTQLTDLVVNASFGDINLPGDFTNAPSQSLNSVTSTQVETNNSGQPVEVGSVTSSIKGNTVTIKGTVSNPSNARPFPIFADQFLGTNGPIVSQKLLTISVTGALSYNLQKIIYITGKGTVTQDAQHQNLNSVTISGKANYTAPTFTFINPAANARLTTNQLTVYTLIKDAGSVSNVEFSLNGSGFQTGVQLSSNIWLSSQLTLSPGTNVIKAYAVDADGYFSSTNTLAVQYVVVAPLTLNISGSGTVSPNYSNALLAIGGSYTIKALPAHGFGFYFWNVGTTMSNNATLKFTMVSNLVITANFKDITPPTVTITSPTTGAKESNSLVNIAGTASDNVGVDLVAIRINSNAWVTVSGTTSWNWNLKAAPGANTVQAYAMDLAGNISKTNTVKFTGVFPPDWAPVFLAGSTMLVTPAGGNPLTVSFGIDTFSQSDILTNNDSSTGVYGYLQTDTNSASLALTNTAPLSLSNNTPSNIQLSFTSLNTGVFTNDADDSINGTFSIIGSTNFLPTAWSGHTVTAVDASDTNTNVYKFTSATAVTINSAIAGNYTVISASPIGAMLVITDDNSTNITYVQLTFDAKTGGHYEVNTFPGPGLPAEVSDFGTFTFK